MPTLELQALPVSLATSTAQMSNGSVVLVVSSLRTYAIASGEMSGRALALSAAPASYAVAAGQLSGRAVLLAARPESFAVASGRLSGNAEILTASPTTYSIASAALGGNAKLIAASPRTYATVSATLTGASDEHGMSICDVRDDILSMWGILTPCAAPDFAKEAAINIINSSLQLVWNNARERSYWSSSTLTLTFAADEASHDLPDDIQNVVGPCRRSDNRRPLAPIGTIGELETFSDIYLDGETADEPLAYHVERLNQAGNDPAKTVLHVTPTPAEETAFSLEVVLEAPRFNLGDFTSCPIIPIPHSYVESLLLPVVRYQATAFYLFRKADQKETIDREYQQARISLGLADPLPGKSGDNKEGAPAK
jgi:hypothetical protein